MSKMTLLDIAKSNGSDAVVGLVEENIAYAPEMGIFDARTIKGTNFKSLIRTGLPTVGFRNANGGVTPSKSTYANKLVETYILSCRIEIDKAVLAASEDGPEVVKAREASGVMEAAMRWIGGQIFYGTGKDAKGFPGFKALVDSTMDVDATGSTASTGSSVWAVKFGPQFVQLIMGMGASFTLGDFRDESISDANGAKLPGEVADLMAWVGLSMQNKYSIGRIRDLTADNGKGLTDLLLADLMAKFPTGIVPDAIFMSRRSRSQLQKARTVVLNGNGTSRPNQPAIAPLPTEYDGVPIIATDSISNTEELDLA